MSGETIQTRIEDRIAVLTFNRPQVLNAFNRTLMREVTEALDAFSADPKVLAIVVHGAGRAFSAGFDLKESAEQATEGTDAWRAVLEQDFDFIIQFWDCRKPTIAAIHGFCFAGAFKMLRAIGELQEAPTGKPQTVAEPTGRDHAERRPLTVMFCDLVGSTALSARLDPEDMRQIMALFHHRVAEVICGHQGIVAQHMGDGVLCLDITVFADCISYLVLTLSGVVRAEHLPRPKDAAPAAALMLTPRGGTEIVRTLSSVSR
jgi:hypothetical protein